MSVESPGARTATRIVLLAAALWSAGFVSEQDTFYDAYEVGLVHERAGRWDRALVAFEAAKRLRPEAGRDVPTFGLDTIELYDPHLHLAIVKLEFGRTADAADDLARSQGVSPPEEIETVRDER